MPSDSLTSTRMGIVIEPFEIGIVIQSSGYAAGITVVGSGSPLAYGPFISSGG